MSVCVDMFHYCFIVLSRMLGETIKIVYSISPNTDNAALNIFVQFSLCREIPRCRVIGQRTCALDIWIGPLSCPLKQIAIPTRSATERA